MRPTMADVAEYAGVSTTTVSLVLNDKPGVSSEVRTSVMQAVDELGYHLPKRRLSRTSPDTKTITVVHFARPRSSAQSIVSGISANYVNGIQDFCQSQNINWVMIANYQEGDGEHVGFHLLAGEKLSFDGLIMLEMPSRDSSLLCQAIKDNIPTVVISRTWPDLPVSAVGQDHCQQANLAVEHLIQLGHRNIAFLASEHDRPYDWFNVRLACYRQKMNALGIYDSDLVAVGSDAADAVQVLLAQRPDVTAIFAVNDSTAVQTMCGLRQANIAIPQQVSVIGLDNAGLATDGYPSLTTVAFPHYKVGYLAAELLMQQIEDKDLFYSQVFVRSQLIQRDSCARNPHADILYADVSGVSVPAQIAQGG